VLAEYGMWGVESFYYYNYCIILTVFPQLAHYMLNK
jgi:hypothetical protein